MGGYGDAELIISEISPGNYIELYNASGAAIDLGAGMHQLCSPFDYVAVSTLSTATVQPNSFQIIAWSSLFDGNSGTDANGEIILYSDGGNFSDGARIMDYVCWGAPANSRKTLAAGVGKWSGAADACPAALGASAIHRNVASDGAAVASYDVAAVQSPNSCLGI